MTEYKSLDYEQLCVHVEKLRAHLAEVERYRDEKSGAHATLLAVNNGFDWPECDGGWHVEDVTSELYRNEVGLWMVEVNVRYEHDDDRGEPHEARGVFAVVDGRFCDVSQHWKNVDLADAGDVVACREAVADFFDFDGCF